MMIGKFFGQRGLAPVIIFEIIFDLALYIFCLFWEPTSRTTWIVYVLFGLLGIYNSTTGMINARKIRLIVVYTVKECGTKDEKLSMLQQQ